MATNRKTGTNIWTGRKSDSQLYLHEKVECGSAVAAIQKNTIGKDYAILGYACDEGVQRNQGRIGAVKAPDVIRTQLGKQPNHLHKTTRLLDVGNIHCLDNDMETTQKDLAKNVSLLLEKNMFPIVLGGGHDVAYGTFNGIKNQLAKGKTIGILNFDAHFDLRSNENGNTSGTPFYQIAQDSKADGADFNYLCLGIREDANDKTLFEIAKKLNVQYVAQNNFSLHYLEQVQGILMPFITAVNYIYCTIDMDGFSSAYAPGVSAASPMGFAPDIVLECLKLILDTKKLIALDIAELNPQYDIDQQTAKLAASLVHYVIHNR